MNVRRVATGVVTAIGLPTLAHLAPATAVLGQWAPPGLHLPPALPGGLCRWRGAAGPMVALTFDDGPSPASTPRVLDLLLQLETRATFFVLGELVEQHPALVERIVADGHEVAFHGGRHVHHLARTLPAIERDLREGVAVLAGAGVRPRFFRPPYGQISAGTLVAAHRLGLETVLWSAWGREWRDRDPRSVARRVAARLGPGTIVLLHDTDHTAPAGTWRVAYGAIPQVVEEVVRRGLQPVTLGAMVGPAAGA